MSRLFFPEISTLGPTYKHLKDAPRYSNNSLIVVAVEPEASARAVRLAQAFHARYPRIAVTVLGQAGECIVSSTGQECGLTWLPMPSPRRTWALLKVTNPGLVLFGGAPEASVKHVRCAAHRRGCSLAIVAPTPANSAAINNLLSRHQADHLFAYSSNKRCAPLIDGVTDIDADNESATMERLKALAQQQVRLVAFLRRKPARLPGIQRRLAAAKFPPIESIVHLRTLLSTPQTVMCLGNGPSSEAPGLDRLGFDCLFRVNYSWAARGRFTQPDLVFTHLLEAFRRLRPSVGFVVRRAVDERYLRWRFRWLPRRLRLATAERLQVMDPAGQSGARMEPSTGVIMLATAIALRPRRLIVAGIDLFSDQAGAYPGDQQTVNDYSLDHDRESERRYIRDLLGQYGGELRVFGDALNQLVADAG